MVWFSAIPNLLLTILICANHPVVVLISSFMYGQKLALSSSCLFFSLMSACYHVAKAITASVYVIGGVGFPNHYVLKPVSTTRRSLRSAGLCLSSLPSLTMLLRHASMKEQLLWRLKLNPCPLPPPTKCQPRSSGKSSSLPPSAP